MEEHQLILRALDALDAFAERAARGGEEREELGRFVRFIREFADARHHGKEEDILFQAMVQAGFPSRGGPIAVMLMEHEEGRSQVARLRALVEQAGAWTDGDRETLREAASGYTNLLRGHIEKEDGVLYPMAQQHLPPEAMRQVDLRCAAFQARHVPAEGPDPLRGLGEELVARHCSG